MTEEPPLSARAGHAGSADVRASLAAALNRVAAGDHQAFADVYQRTSPKLFGVCLRILTSRHEAEEALQEAYLAIWRRAASFDPDRGNPMAWLIAIARNAAVDRLRVTRPVAQLPIGLADMVADPMPLASDMLMDREEKQRLADCLDLLEAYDMRLIRTAFLEGSTYAELAARASTPLGTVKSRIRRALVKLRECL